MRAAEQDLGARAAHADRAEQSALDEVGARAGDDRLDFALAPRLAGVEVDEELAAREAGRRRARGAARRRPPPRRRARRAPARARRPLRRSRGTRPARLREVLLEVRDGPLPGELRRFLVVARRRVVVEAVLRA